MTQTTSPGTVLPTAANRRAYHRALEQVLDHAFARARDVGYRAVSSEMDALARAESRYQQAKGH